MGIYHIVYNGDIMWMSGDIANYNQLMQIKKGVQLQQLSPTGNWLSSPGKKHMKLPSKSEDPEFQDSGYVNGLV